MTLDNDLLTQINNYLDHKLTNDERLVFEQQIAADAELKAEVNRQSIIREAVLRKEYKSLFKQIHDELTAQGEPSILTPPLIRPEKSDRVLPIRWYHWAMAASVALLLGLGWILFMQGPDNEQLYLTHFSAQPKQPTHIIDPEIMGSSRQPTELADSMQVAQAIGQLKKGDTQRATELLQQVANTSGNHWGRVAEWYLALAYLKNDRTEEARKQLQSIVQDMTHPYYKEAVALLKELD